MSVFKAAFINELEKIYRKKKVLLAVIISTLGVIIGQLIVVAARNGFGTRGVNGVQFCLLVLSVFSSTVIPLFSALVTIDTFSGEISNNTMKITLTRPITRFKLFTSKIAAVGVFISALLVFVMILSLVFGIIFNYSGISVGGFFDVIISYIVTIVPLMVLTVLIGVLANILSSGVAAFFLSVLVFIGLKAASIFFLQYSSLFIVPMLDWYNLWIAGIKPVLRILREFLIMSGCGIMLFTYGYYLFDKKEF